MYKRLLGTLAAVALIAAPLSVSAKTVSSTLPLGGTVVTSCAITSIAPPPSFNITPGQAMSQASGSITLVCTNGSAFTIALNAGLNGTDGPTPTRAIRNGPFSLGYAIYRDAADALPFGDSIGVNTYASVGSGSTQNISFYIQLALPPPNVAVGDYSDTVQVVVTF